MSDSPNSRKHEVRGPDRRVASAMDDKCLTCGHARWQHGQMQPKGSTWCAAPASGERAAPFHSICNCSEFIEPTPYPKTYYVRNAEEEQKLFDELSANFTVKSPL